MATARAQGKRIMKQKSKEEEEEDQGFGLGFGEDDKNKREVTAGRKGSAGGGVSPACCQAEKCNSDLTGAKRYHRRHKVCQLHAKAPVVLVAGLRQRFCQQCSRFHELSEFDEAKRSCRRRLAGHNERRRKNSSGSLGEGSNHKGLNPQLKEIHSRHADERGRIQITLSGNTAYKHFHIR
ncbi:hypothetical protein HHK36_023627 [Tetracentron sinense]|uniref:SBP-type domain-containing protein n=1 Tax=Tetracentron sinense TaxID=13715 RepID=A0A835D5E1_TETSI|nr:hypothetical protein HHK36_023627 [Tetracentron sinense]